MNVSYENRVAIHPISATSEGIRRRRRSLSFLEKLCVFFAQLADLFGDEAFRLVVRFVASPIAVTGAIGVIVSMGQGTLSLVPGLILLAVALSAAYLSMRPIRARKNRS